MNRRWLCVLAAAGMVAAAFVPEASAQSNRPAKLSQPQLRDDEQIMPSQIVRPPPAAPAKPKPAARPPAPDPNEDPVAVAKPAAQPRPTEPAKPADSGRVVACSGAFAKNSGHLRLAQSYGVHNVDYAEVSGDDGSALM